MRYVVSQTQHDKLVSKAWDARGYSEEEVRETVRLCADTARHGIHTHNAIKALHLDDLFGSKVGGCVPKAKLEVQKGRFPAAQVWDANRKMGPPVAYNAIDACIQLADQYGLGLVSVDNAFHYFWGGSYVLEAARRGYIGYTQCTAMLAEVVPFGGTRPALGTNPHSWAFPTTEAVGFPVLVDWATSAIAMGRVQQLKREEQPLPLNCAVDAAGEMTTDPERVAGLLPFGGHKGYGLGLINELIAGFVGGGLPSIRGRFLDGSEKHSPCFVFLVIHPEAISSFGKGSDRSQSDNVKAVLNEIIGSENANSILPGQPEATQAAISEQHGGFLFSKSEIEFFNSIAIECGEEQWQLDNLRCID